MKATPNNKAWNVAHERVGGWEIEKGKILLSDVEFEKLKAISNCNWLLFVNPETQPRAGVTSLNFKSAE